MAKFLGFTADTTDQAAAAVFRDRYGREPAEILRSNGMVAVGPIPEPEMQDPPTLDMANLPLFAERR